VKYLKLFGAVSIWAMINGLVVKGVNADPTAIGLYMGLIGGIFAGAYLIYLNCVKGEHPFAGLDAKKLMLLVGLGVAAGANNVFFYVALKHKVANAALVHYLAQPISLIFLATFLGEKLFKRHFAAMGLGFAGAAMMAWDSGRFHVDTFFVYALLSASFFAGEITFSKALGKYGVHPHLSAFTKLSFQVAAMAIGSVVLGQSLSLGPGETKKVFAAGALLYLSFVWLFDALADSPGCKAVPGSDFGIIGYVDRLGAVAFGILVFHEALTRSVIMGGVLILLAQALVLFGREKSSS
jgi:drug/metabolite transporter (DMT)-like permease